MDNLDELKQRQAQFEAEAPETGNGPRSEVGAGLRAARIRAGYELSDIVQALHIRRIHLLAIEEGRFSDLPGPAYAVGFLRSYAEFLGLDGDDAVRLFKDEAREFGAATKLVFPAPSQESKRPTAAVVTISLLVAVAIYGAGHYISVKDRMVIEAVSEPPERLVAAALEGAAPAGESAEIADIAGLEPAAGGPAAAEVAPGPAAGTLWASEPTSGSAAAALARAEDVGAGLAPPFPEEGGDLQLTPPASPIRKDALVAPPEPALPPLAEAPSSMGGSAGYVPQVYGAGNKEARVVLRAHMDSWVQIQGANNELVLTRILRAGDIYQVPNRTDLVMTTGNAGALEITVDGKPIPRVGPVGAVRRGISLDVDRLLNRGAASE